MKMENGQNSSGSFTPLQEAVEILKKGGIVAAATETFFGLLADIYREDTIERLKKIKKLQPNDPLIIIAPSFDEVMKMCEIISPHALKLIERYWPGPLTLILKARISLPSYITGPFSTIAVRVPGGCDAGEIVKKFMGPLTATSCNVHRQPPVTSSREALEKFGKEIDFIVPGWSPGGLPSTIVDVTVTPPVIRRRGIVNVEGKYLRQKL